MNRGDAIRRRKKRRAQEEETAACIDEDRSTHPFAAWSGASGPVWLGPGTAAYPRNQSLGNIALPLALLDEKDEQNGSKHQDDPDKRWALPER